MILACQNLVLKLCIQASLRKVVSKIWNSLQNIQGILLKIWDEIKLFQIYPMRLASVLWIRKWCTQLEFQRASLLLFILSIILCFCFFCKITFLFKKYIESSFCFTLAWLAIFMPGNREFNFVSNYILIFGNLFHIYKLIHFDLKPRTLIDSFLLALLLNN